MNYNILLLRALSLKNIFHIFSSYSREVRWFDDEDAAEEIVYNFTAAVVPNDMPLDIYGRLNDANVEIFEYEKGSKASRAEAMQKASAM